MSTLFVVAFVISFAVTSAIPAALCNGDPSTDWECCTEANQCDIGGGHCEKNSQCKGQLQCGKNNCKTEFSSNPGSNWDQNADCCYSPVIIEKCPESKLLVVVTVHCEFQVTAVKETYKKKETIKSSEIFSNHFKQLDVSGQLEAGYMGFSTKIQSDFNRITNSTNEESNYQHVNTINSTKYQDGTYQMKRILTTLISVGHSSMTSVEVEVVNAVSEERTQEQLHQIAVNETERMYHGKGGIFDRNTYQERACMATTESDDFLCEKSGKVSKAFRCDGNIDCDDWSDEWLCPGSCTDNKINQDETSVDCGGVCGPWDTCVRHKETNCWEECNKQGGGCDHFCGGGGLCCRKDWTGSGCDGSMGGDIEHQCVAKRGCSSDSECRSHETCHWDLGCVAWNYRCYHYTDEDWVKINMHGWSAEDEMKTCREHGYVYTNGEDWKAPGCGSCSCCQPWFGNAFGCDSDHVALKTIHGKYLNAESDGDLHAFNDWIGSWENFQVIDLGSARIRLKSTHGKYVTARGWGQGWKVNANKDSAGSWEEFSVEQQEGGTFALKTAHGRYIIAEEYGWVKGYAEWPGAWERFYAICLDW